MQIQQSINTNESLDFLKGMNPTGPYHLVAIAEGNGPITATFSLDQVDEAATWINKHNTNAANIYFHVNPLNDKIRHRKAKKTDVEHVVVFHVDVDDPNTAALDRIRSYSPQPTAIIFSGGGYQAFWLLKQPMTNFEKAETINKSIARDLGGDNCHNVDRIMRVPGTINWPNAKKRAAGREKSLAYVVSQFTNYGFTFDAEAIVRSSPAVSPEQAKFADQPCPAEIPIKTLEELGQAENNAVASIVRAGDDPERPRGSKNARYPSRSEPVWFISCRLATLGHSPEEIAGVLLNSEYGISESILEKTNSKEYAWQQACKAKEIATIRFPDTYKDGGPKPTLANVLLALNYLGCEFEYDIFHNRMRVSGHALQADMSELTDKIIAILRKLILDTFGYDPNKYHLQDAVQILCLENARHPVRDYLDSLSWDRNKRLETWMIDYLGADDNELNRAIGLITLVAAVRRVRQPGCKFDTMVVLEGKQGSGKSSVLLILAGEENFSDQHLFGLDDKAQMEALEGVWIFEVAELDGISRAETSKAKALISRTEDRVRPAYARYKETVARQCILVGTTNEFAYLKDATGNRRFLPVKTGVIDLEELQQDREQLWAEAAQLEAQGYSITLPKELWDDAAAQQEGRMQEHPWLDVLSLVRGVVKDRMERVATETLFSESYLDIAVAQRQAYHPKNLATNMRKLGWEGPIKLRINGSVVRGYQRPTDAENDPQI